METTIAFEKPVAGKRSILNFIISIRIHYTLWPAPGPLKPGPEDLMPTTTSTLPHQLAPVLAIPKFTRLLIFAGEIWYACFGFRAAQGAVPPVFNEVNYAA